MRGNIYIEVGDMHGSMTRASIRKGMLSTAIQRRLYVPEQVLRKVGFTGDYVTDAPFVFAWDPMDKRLSALERLMRADIWDRIHADRT